ncbi:hypothetical protein SAMD00023353_1200690 [Rosellinia necatrix]|uniref:Uncharacterized protein n=1 Tax=Rosellinia necatrix TaxID=77044 RepID=A0A1S8A6L0_ROSNE|nr:hypothetical protein SAMD00023353_1200690 [Rosellinia necatrix]
MVETTEDQNATALEGEALRSLVRPAAGRLPSRLRNTNALYERVTGDSVTCMAKRQRGSSQRDLWAPFTIDIKTDPSQISSENPQWYHTASREGGLQTDCSSRHPVEWLDRVLETSYATRCPISPKLCVSTVAMDCLRQKKTCIFVKAPQDHGLPEPLRCYPSFRAALEDICDRFRSFFAPFAAYNSRTQTVILYETGAARPEHKFLNKDTAVFNIELAHSAVSDPRGDFSSGPNRSQESIRICPFQPYSFPNNPAQT